MKSILNWKGTCTTVQNPTYLLDRHIQCIKCFKSNVRLCLMLTCTHACLFVQYIILVTDANPLCYVGHLLHCCSIN